MTFYDTDRTGYYFRTVLNKLLTLQNKMCKDGKIVKGILTIMLCCSVASEKEELLVVRKNH